MTNWPKWLEISGYALDLLGVLVAAWYFVDKLREQAARNANKKTSDAWNPRPRNHDEYKPSGTTWDALSRLPQVDRDTDIETGAEELLAARMTPLTDPFLHTVFQWGQGLAGKLKPLGWLRFPLLAPLALVFFILFGLLLLLLLPLLAVGYFFDLDKDFRLRIIVLAFMIGILFQILRALIR